MARIHILKIDAAFDNILGETDCLTKTSTAECIRDCFTHFESPVMVVSDNGSQFSSYDFHKFMQNNGVTHKICAPYKPSSNSQAERKFINFKTFSSSNVKVFW